MPVLIEYKYSYYKEIILRQYLKLQIFGKLGNQEKVL